MTSIDLPALDARVRPPVVRFGPFSFDAANQLLRRGAEELSLPPRALGVLAALLERPGDLVSRQQLIERVWKDAFVTDTSLAEAVSVLRQALGDDAQAPAYVQTVHRRGYRFVAAVDGDVHRAVADHPGPSPVPSDSDSDRTGPSIGGWLLPWTVAALALVLAAVAVWRAVGRPDDPPAAVRFALTLPDGLAVNSNGNALALSPGGDSLVISACDAATCRLYQRSLDAMALQPIAGTEHAHSPFFSPDGRWVGFFADGKIRKAALAGGTPVTLADLSDGRGGAWTADGRIIAGAAYAGGLVQIPDSGGVASPLTTPRADDGEIWHGWPALAPDGRSLLFVSGTSPEGAAARLVAAPLERGGTIGAWSTLLSETARACPLGRDLVVLSRGADVQVSRIDWTRLRLERPPQTLASAAADTNGAAQFATSARGALASVLPAGGTARHLLAWWTDGHLEPVPETLAGVHHPALSRDGAHVAWSATNGADRSDIWTADVARGAGTRVTFTGTNAFPVWTPDGSRIVFSTSSGGRFRVASAPVDGGPAATIDGSGLPSFPGSVSSDGRTLAVVSIAPDTRADIWLVSLAAGTSTRLVATPFDEREPAFSPDGELLAYQSDESGRKEIYLIGLRDGRRTTVSATGGTGPFWSADGKTLYFTSGRRLLRAPVGIGPAVGPVTEVLRLDGLVSAAAAADGRLLLELDTVPSRTSVLVSLAWDRVAAAALGPPTTSMPR